ncbi:hypothetical protein HF086_007676 [Spodoptera exigua]|uniref:Uncharacterized protein n=1 Tax=Spodoptera exigua TaxID=7107 RepID=A0A922MST6_SPOEX|nr:hypothetical protein HF086_007676 [Spodoptera exigua]
MAKLVVLVLCVVLVYTISAKYVDKRKCPEVRAVPHFDLPRMLGDWFVVEYYASAEEALSYSCMKAVFTEDDHVPTADDGIYNTYVLDTEYKTWALLLHCAEQTEGARYLSAFVLSRNTTLPKNVMAYLRDKLPRYDVDVNYVFPIPHKDCSTKPPMFDYSPILVEVGSKVPKRPGVSYKVAFGH